MTRITMSLLRGICQTPAYVAYEQGYFKELDLEVEIQISPTAWLVPKQMLDGTVDFAVIPWTRIAVANTQSEPLVIICGSGYEEAAMVVRKGVDEENVQAVSVPREGGIKDLTAAALIKMLGWNGVTLLRQPSGDGAILSLVGQGADAASMVEPYASMLEHLQIGRIIKRTGDMWPGAPGCSLTTTRAMIREHPDVVSRLVHGFVRGAEFVNTNPDMAAQLSTRYIGVSSEIIRLALKHNRPNVNALSNKEAMAGILSLMRSLKYISRDPDEGYLDLRFLHAIRKP